jgi:hypothetical protein
VVKRSILGTLILVTIASSAIAGPVFPTRGFLISPRWTGKVDTTPVFDHASYFAELQRGIGSDSDRWGWSISMGAIWEFARWGGNKSLIAFSGMELTADTHNDISFNPRGAFWEEGLLYCVQGENGIDWSVGSIYRCRHDIDNADPAQYSGFNQGRTLIYCSLKGIVNAWTKESKYFQNYPSKWMLPDLASFRGDFYLIREDYRIPAIDTEQPNYSYLIGTLGAQLKWNLKQWEKSALYFSYGLNFSYFSNNRGFWSRFSYLAEITKDSRGELGYTYEGRAGRIQIYGGYESWEDDGQVPTPRNASYATLGVRVTGSDLVTY